MPQDTQQPRLVEHPTNLAEFASDLAELGPFTAADLARAYLDQNLAEGEDFRKAVKAFIPACRYYV